MRRARDRRLVTLASAGVALLFHVGVIAAVGAVGVGVVSKGMGGVGASAQEQASELESSCGGDVLLAAAARGSLCFSPWAGSEGIERCWQGLSTQARFELSDCRGDNTPASALAFLPPEAQAKLRAIDPEKLLEEAKLLPPTPPPPPPQPQVAAAPPPPPPPAAPPPQRRAQIVETAKPEKEEIDENARLLAEYNTKAEKQTVARGSRFEDMVAKSKPAELEAKANAKEASIKPETLERDPGSQRDAPDAPGKLAMRIPGAPVLAPAAQEAKTRGSLTGLTAAAGDGVFARRGQGAVEQARQDPTHVDAGQGGAGGGSPRVPNLRPSDEVLERVVGGGNVDHIEDAEEGELTALSAKQDKFASFFNRMKRQVAQNWEAGSVWRRRDPTGAVYGFKSRITEVRVSLSPKGELVKVQVVTPSGVAELDEEAMRAFRAAAPFPNPPEGLITASTGLITFEFGFHMSVGRPTMSHRMLRRE